MRRTATCLTLLAVATFVARSAFATPVFDDQRGTAKDTFRDTGGIASASGVTVDTNAGLVHLTTPNTVGTFRTSPYEPGVLVCDNNALNVTGSGVTTGYTSPAGAAFTHAWECDSGKAPVNQSLACEGSFDNKNKVTVDVLPTPAGLSVTIGGMRSPTYVLPDERYVGNGATCCVNPCCDASTD